MNMKKFYNLYTLICLFPAWLLSSNIILYDKSIYFLPYIFFFIILTSYLNLGQKSKFNLIILAIITVFSLDQNLSLYQNLVKPNFIFLSNNIANIYYVNILSIIVIFITILIILNISKTKSIKILFSFLLIVFIFKVYEVTKNSVKIIDFDMTEKIESSNSPNKKVLIIVLDEMSGIDATEKDYEFGDVFDQTINNFAIKYDLNLYEKSYSLSENTANSVPFMLNFETKIPTTKLREQYIEVSTLNYDYDVIQNKIFEKFNNISVMQNVHLNYCNQKNVKKCSQINPYENNKNYINGFKDNLLTHFFSRWKMDGSLLSTLFFKTSRILGLTDSILEPESHKIFLPLILSKLENDIKENKFDLIFAHILAPHTPYGFSRDCKYDGKRSSYNTLMTDKEKYIQHNVERICMIKFVDNFFNNIKMLPEYDNLDIFIMSDHGSKIDHEESLSSIFFTKIHNNNFKIIKKKVLIHREIKEIFQKSYR